MPDNTQEKIALFDLDNTLADYAGQLNKDLEALRSPVEPIFTVDQEGDETPEYILNRMRLLKKSPQWWAKLPRLDDGFEILRRCLQIGFMPEILTKGPAKTTTAWEQKVIWVQENVDPFYSHYQGHPDSVPVTITHNKGRYYGSVLVDDWPNFMEGWLKHRPRGLGIMPLRDYNKDFFHPQVIHFDHTSEDSVNRMVFRLKEVWDR